MAETREQLQARLAALRKLMPERKCQAASLQGRRCTQPSPGYYRTTCQHGHVHDLYLCAGHAGRTDGACRICSQHPQDAHRCSLSVVPLVMGTDGWQPDDGQSRA